MRDMHISEIWTIIKTRHGSAVLLKPRDIDFVVPIFIGSLEMQAILIAKEGIKMPRPMTHDLFLDMLNHVNLSIKRVEIHELVNDTFHARLVITGGEYTNEKPLILDSRPSDALAVASQKRCPIYIAAPIIEQVGIAIDYFFDPLDDPPRDQSRSLFEQLEQAVAEEEYEQAAEIRDLIKKLEEEE